MKDRIVVVTGGATGMGRAVVEELISENTVVSIDRAPAKIAALREALPRVHSVKADLTSRDERNDAVASIEKSFGRIDVLINNAGKGGSLDFVGADEDALARDVEVSWPSITKYPSCLRNERSPCFGDRSSPSW
jgi:NAD(P)-dependent dehydrogenase (short-subunit alcohol dehydrogenase family)